MMPTLLTPSYVKVFTVLDKHCWNQKMFQLAVLLAAYFVNALVLVEVGTTFYIQYLFSPSLKKNTLVRYIVL